MKLIFVLQPLSPGAAPVSSAFEDEFGEGGIRYRLGATFLKKISEHPASLGLTAKPCPSDHLPPEAAFAHLLQF